MVDFVVIKNGVRKSESERKNVKYKKKITKQINKIGFDICQMFFPLLLLLLLPAASTAIKKRSAASAAKCACLFSNTQLCSDIVVFGFFVLLWLSVGLAFAVVIIIIVQLISEFPGATAVLWQML